jgi:hypothetical protein
MLRRLILACTATALVAAVGLPSNAQAACNGIPETPQTYIDFADGTVKFRGLFAQRGLSVATMGRAIPREFRLAGVGTAYFELHLENLVGLPNSPKPASGIVAAADAEFATAVDSTQCSTPLIALDEIEGGNAAGPFTGRTATYRQNILTLINRLRANGARVFLLIPGGFSVSERGAATYWRQAAADSELIPEVYPNGKTMYGQGPIVGNRNIRIAYRNALRSLIALGIPPQRLGLFIGFQSQRGNGGREGLTPRSAWMRVVKWMTIDAGTVARELGIGTVWSWGWGTYSAAGADNDKSIAACVYLWTRNSGLCPQAPSRAGSDFNTSLREGRLSVPGGKHCVWKGGGRIRSGDVIRLAPITGGRPRALTVLFEATLSREAPGVSGDLISRAEASIVKRRFGGSRGKYLDALRKRGLSKKIADLVIADQLARREVPRRRKGKDAFASWLSSGQTSALKTMTCRTDEVPAKGEVNATRWLSFLKLPR